MPQPLTRMIENVRKQDPAKGFEGRRKGGEIKREALNTNTMQVLSNPLSAMSPKVLLHKTLRTCYTLT